MSARGAVAFAAALTLSTGHALAQPAQQNQGAPPVQGLYSAGEAARYSTPDGAVRFVLDRSGGRAALVRFEGDPEVHVLRPVMGRGGDEIYTTESGDVQLRVTRHGGVTVYTRAHRTGAPASEEARVDPLAPSAMALAQMQARMQALQARAARNIGQRVTFAPPGQVAGPDIAGAVVDAAEVAAKGLQDAPLTTVRRVVIVLGPRPGAVMRGDMLIVQITPQLGYAGRPSSNTIRNVATGQVQGPEE